MLNREAFDKEAWDDMRKRLIELGRLDLPLSLAVVEEVEEDIMCISLSELVGSELGDAIQSTKGGNYLTSTTILPSTKLAALKFCILSPDLTWYRLTCKITQCQTPTS